MMWKHLACSNAGDKMQEPLISVIIPTYNRAADVRDARLLATVESVLNQTHRNLEVIVVDDCAATPAAQSLDDIRDTRLRIIRHKINRDVSAARNTGIAHAQGTLLAFLDHDDLWRPEKLAHQIAFMNHERSLASVTDFTAPKGHSEYNRHNSNKNPTWLILTGSFLAMASSMLARRETIEAIGQFDTRMPSLQDWDWLLRYHKHGYKLTIVPEALTVYAGSHRRAPEVELKDLELVKEQYASALPTKERSIFEAALKWRAARAIFTQHHISGAGKLIVAGAKHPVYFGRYICGVYEGVFHRCAPV